MHLSDDAVMSRKISTEVIKSLEQMLGEFISHLETRGDLGRVSPCRWHVELFLVIFYWLLKSICLFGYFTKQITSTAGAWIFLF